MEERKTTKQLRKENKLRKMAAFLEVAEMNEKERQNVAAVSCQVNLNKSRHSSDPQDGEPSSKKLKANDETSDPSVKLDLLNGDRPKFSEKELAELRGLLKQRAKALKKTPLLTLKEPAGFQACLDVPATNRVPLFFKDIQNLLLYTLFNKSAHAVPRWCQVSGSGGLKSVRVLLIEGAGLSDYLMAKEKLPALSESLFPFQLEVIMPSAYNGDLIEEFCAIPIPRLEYNRLVSTHGSVQKVLQANCGVFKVLRAFFNVSQKSEAGNPDIGKKKNNNKGKKTSAGLESSNEALPESVPPIDKEDASTDVKHDNIISEQLPPSDTFPRTSLLLSAWQMVEENYPIPLNAALKEKYKDFVLTKQRYKEVSNFSPMYALDCEMCITTSGKSECTRVSIVTESHETLLDTLVLPYNRITNYLTRFSGITPKLMEGCTTRLKDVQKFIQENIEPDAILVGQSLNFDLISLQIMHPYCIDTSVVFNVSGDRYKKSKLSYLADRFLNETIQAGNKGHSSVEDSIASLKLIQLKLSQSIEFGDEVLINQGKSMTDVVIQATPKLESQPKEKADISGYASSLFSYASRSGKNASIIAPPEVLETYVDYLDARTIMCEQINEDGSNKVTAEKKESNYGQVICIASDSNNSTIEKIATETTGNFLSVGHIQLSDQECDSLTVGDNDTLEKLNSWVLQMHESTPLNSLSIVLLCGKEKSSNGVCFMNLRKQNHQRLSFKPNELD